MPLCRGQPSGWSILLPSAALAHLALGQWPVDSELLRYTEGSVAPAGTSLSEVVEELGLFLE